MILESQVTFKFISMSVERISWHSLPCMSLQVQKMWIRLIHSLRFCPSATGYIYVLLITLPVHLPAPVFSLFRDFHFVQLEPLLQVEDLSLNRNVFVY